MHRIEAGIEPIPRRAGMTTAREMTNPTHRREERKPLDEDIRAMSEQRGSGVRMCHEQGKTAVYLSNDGRSIVEHEPHGVIRHLPLDTDPRSDT